MQVVHISVYLSTKGIERMGGTCAGGVWLTLVSSLVYWFLPQGGQGGLSEHTKPLLVEVGLTRLDLGKARCVRELIAGI